MKYNIEKINLIAKQLAEIVEEALEEASKEGVLIGEIEMGMRESLREIGKSALKCFLENAEREVEAEIECGCGGKLQYQRRREATLWSVFGKMTYTRAYYSGCKCGEGQALLDQRYGIESGKVTAGLAHLLALSGIDKSFEEGQEWLNACLLFEVSENTIRAETQFLGELHTCLICLANHGRCQGRQADEDLIKEMHNETTLQKREQAAKNVPDRLYGSIDAAKVRIESRVKQGKKAETVFIR